MITHLRSTKPVLAFALALACGAAGLVTPSATTLAADASPAVAGVPAAPRVGELRVAMRTLWEDHITYTRNYIISALADLPDKDAVAARLLANQDAIGADIKPYYGEAAGDKLAGLLRDHILIATKVVDAAKTGDGDALAATQDEWSANGKDIAAFLSGANPNWSRAELEAALQKHLDLTTGEVVARLNKDWEADIHSYDLGHQHMLMFADTLTTGIAKQFPSKVGK
jgi:hypothetical protein